MIAFLISVKVAKKYQRGAPSGVFLIKISALSNDSISAHF